VSRRRPLAALALVAAALAVTSACEVRTVVDVAVSDDGSGTVTVTVALDEEALGRVPDADDDGTSGPADVAALVRTDDMAAAGWAVGEPAATDDGGASITASKPFGTPDEAVAVLSEITGAEGALRDLRLERSTGFGSTSFEFAGTVDLSGGLEAFGDAGLAEVLDGEPLGEDAAVIEERIGRPLAEAFALEVAVALPGSLDAGTGTGEDGAARWTPRLGDAATQMEASSEQREVLPLLLVGVAVVSAAACVALVGLRLVRRR
jgi:hypothetical protein